MTYDSLKFPTKIRNFHLEKILNQFEAQNMIGKNFWISEKEKQHFILKKGRDKTNKIGLYLVFHQRNLTIELLFFALAIYFFSVSEEEKPYFCGKFQRTADHVIKNRITAVIFRYLMQIDILCVSSRISYKSECTSFYLNSCFL